MPLTPALLLEEVFVHWERERRLAFYPVLRELARERQLLLFTCHDFLAEELERELGVRATTILDLLHEAGAPA